MRVRDVRLRDFRSHRRLDVELAEGVTVVHGPNGAGKTNLLEAIYLACTGRSCRTNNDRELIRFGAGVARAEVSAEGEDGLHELSVGVEAGERRRMLADGVAVERISDLGARPLVGVFLPDRLELVKGAPGVRRAHLDQVVAALWPARRGLRRSYGRALAQRNALLARNRGGTVSPDSLAGWDGELARWGAELMAARREAAAELAGRFASVAGDVGLEDGASLAYRPRSPATDAAELAAELADRRASDLERGFTGHGPHRDELALEHAGRDLRTYGSQGQQRLAVLALLLAEREAIATARGRAPLMLLDDVMSELDAERRAALAALLATGGQAVITATDLAGMPPAATFRTVSLEMGRGGAGGPPVPTGEPALA